MIIFYNYFFASFLCIFLPFFLPFFIASFLSSSVIYFNGLPRGFIITVLDNICNCCCNKTHSNKNVNSMSICHCYVSFNFYMIYFFTRFKKSSAAIINGKNTITQESTLYPILQK